MPQLDHASRDLRSVVGVVDDGLWPSGRHPSYCGLERPQLEPYMKNGLVFFFAIICISLPSTEAEARKGFGSIFKLGRGAKALNGIKEYDFNTLSVEEIRACLFLEQKANKSEKDLELEQPSISEKEKYLTQLDSEINILSRYLELNKNTNFYSQQEVDNFNNKVKRHNELIAVYNKEIASYKSLEATYNSHVTQHNSVVNKFQSECAGKRYYEDDFVAASSNINK